MSIGMYSSKPQPIGAKTFHRIAGFSLIEMLIVVVIVGIITSIAYPNYTRYITRSHRTDAESVLLQLAAQQEKYYLQNGTYGTTAQIGITTSEHGYYSVAIVAGTGGLAAAYTATATATSSQGNDTQCTKFTITQSGAKGAVDSGSTPTDTTAQCWR
jgi:type IV pilus assembly protein PilE